MKKYIKKNSREFFLLLGVLLLGSVYLWFTLPLMSVFIRLMIIIFAFVLVIILGNYLDDELKEKTMP